MKKTKESVQVLFFIKAFLFLVDEKWCLDDLVEMDFRGEMTSNQQMCKSNEETRAKLRETLKQNTLEDRCLFLRKLWDSFCWILSATVFAIALIILFNPTKSFDSFAAKFTGIISIFCFSFATIARLGWEGQTCAGDSVFEKLDGGIFWLMYFLGTFLATISLLVG